VKGILYRIFLSVEEHMLRTDEVTTPLGTVHLAALGSDGSLCGYAWGEHRKRWLLEHESSRAFQRDVRSRPPHGSSPSTKA
jgi:hypothetical protein